MHWYFAALKKYATFSGRAPKLEWWVFLFINIFISLVLVLTGEVMSWFFATADTYTDIAVLLFWLATLLPSISVAVRRLHDVGLSGWYVMLCLWALVYGIVQNFVAVPEDLNATIETVSIISSLLLLYILLGDSEKGDNQYGPNPQGESVPESGKPEAVRFVYWYVAALKKYVVFSGRARRMECWMFLLVNIIIALLLYEIDKAMNWYIVPAADTYYFGTTTFFFFAMLLPSCSVIVRRLHDAGLTGWCAMLYFPYMIVVEISGLQFYNDYNEDDSVSVLWVDIVAGLSSATPSLLSVFIPLLILIYLLIRDSEKGENTYGPNPKGETAPQMAEGE